MAWPEQLPSGRWQGRYRDAAGNTLSAGTFATKKQARDAATVAERNARLNPLDPKARKITWGEWEPRWQAGRRVLAGTKERDDGRIEQHVRPKWGKVKLASITTQDVQTWLNELQVDSGLAPSSAILCYRMLQGSLKAAVNAKLLASNPCKGVTLPKQGAMPDRFIEATELDAIAPHLNDLDRLVIEALHGTGLRLGEMLGLHRENVFADSIEVCRSWDPVGKRMKPTKGYGTREVPLTKDLSKKLMEHLELGGVGRPAPVEYARECKAHSGLLFTGSRVIHGVTGRPLDGDNLRGRWADAIATANALRIKQKTPIMKPPRLHDLRHTYASTLARAGVSIETVRVLLGHESIVTTQRYFKTGTAQWVDVRRALGDDTDTP